jgi:hypothetical protein
LGAKTYDAAASALHNAPANVSVYVFRGGSNPSERVTVIWKSTLGRNDEDAPPLLVDILTPNTQNVFLATYSNARTVQTPSNGKIVVSVSGDALFIVEPDFTPGQTTSSVPATTLTPVTTAAGGGTTAPLATTVPGTTAAAGATSAPAAGGATSAPAAGGATSAPAAGGATSAPAAGGATSAPAAGGATSAPAAGGATSAPAAGGATTTPCVIPTMAQPGGAPCVLECCPNTTGRVRISLKMSTLFSQFNCPSWWNAFSKRASARLCRVWEGSTNIEVDLPTRDASDLTSNPSSASVPDLVLVTDENGRSFSVNSGPDIAMLIGIIIGALILIALIVIVIVLCVRRRRDQKSSALYTPLGESIKSSNTAPVKRMVQLRVIQAAAACGEGTISVNVGDQVSAEPADYADATSEWLWVTTSNGTSGYIPREFART